MNFEESYIYHIYNRGNNRQQVFFTHENYLYFIRKLELYIKPYGDILAWCLMPNHFHIMVRVNKISVGVTQNKKRDTDTNNKKRDTDTTKMKMRTFNDSIGIMLRSYTRSINVQEKRTGKLFREQTKAECVNCIKGVYPSFIVRDGVSFMNVYEPQKEYPQRCFDYIHQNPVKAGLTSYDYEWTYSSAIDYRGMRKNHLVNKEIAKEYISI